MTTAYDSWLAEWRAKWDPHKHPHDPKTGKWMGTGGSSGGGGDSGKHDVPKINADTKSRIEMVASDPANDREDKLSNSVLAKMKNGGKLTDEEKDFVNEHSDAAADHGGYEDFGGTDDTTKGLYAATDPKDFADSTKKFNDAAKAADKHDPTKISKDTKSQIQAVSDAPMSDDQEKLADSVLDKIKNGGPLLTDEEKDFVDEQSDHVADYGGTDALLRPKPQGTGRYSKNDAELDHSIGGRPNPPGDDGSKKLSDWESEVDLTRGEDDFYFRMQRNAWRDGISGAYNDPKGKKDLYEVSVGDDGVEMSEIQKHMLGDFLDQYATEKTSSPADKKQAMGVARRLHDRQLTAEDKQYLVETVGAAKGMSGKNKVASALTAVKKSRSGQPDRAVMRSLPVVRSAAAVASLVDSDDDELWEEDTQVLRASYRADISTNGPMMSLEFSKFGNWYEIDSVFEGRFLERVAPGAFTKTITERASQIKVMFNHGKDPQIAEKILGPIRTLEERNNGTYAEVPLLDTSYNRDLLPGLRAGVYGSSFTFHVMDDQWIRTPSRSDHNPEGIPERTVTAVRLLEFGPVTWPANPGATASARSDTDRYFESMRSNNPDQLAEIARGFREFRAANQLVSRSDGFDSDHAWGTSRREAAGSIEAPDSTQSHATREQAFNSPETRKSRLALAGIGVQQ